MENGDKRLRSSNVEPRVEVILTSMRTEGITCYRLRAPYGVAKALINSGRNIPAVLTVEWAHNFLSTDSILKHSISLLTLSSWEGTDCDQCPYFQWRSGEICSKPRSSSLFYCLLVSESLVLGTLGVSLPYFVWHPKVHCCPDPQVGTMSSVVAWETQRRVTGTNHEYLNI